MQLGAFEKLTGGYIHPSTASKNDREYSCIDCKEDVILCRGDIIRPYFRHFAYTNCNFYDRPSESQIHKDAKLFIKNYIENNKEICIERLCRYKHVTTYLFDLQDCQGKIEYKMYYNSQVKYADVVVLRNGQLTGIFEIYNTHKTKENDRPEPWFDLDVKSLGPIFRCVRIERNCLECKKCLNCYGQNENCLNCKISFSLIKNVCDLQGTLLTDKN